MSVQTYSLIDSIQVSPAAAKHLAGQLQRSGHHGVRITLKESGCSGFMYQMDEVDEPIAGDLTLTLSNGVAVFFDPADAPGLHGTEIDYTREGLNQTLRFRNPNATDACGCGESFNLNTNTADDET
ncbi:MAG: iron-sulfur cluster assembly accessory protein [Proteobacteria bacterium]|jgi:iron-sulfur cluster assembly protein|nr:iron-sulfur cluster assembly accessory protein [Pseudomonadota bacterium]MDA1300234.1 iron-sulfur cluster assembly accessory protein [Pseudomonadota bacterium]